MTTPDGSPDPRPVQLRLVGTFAVARGAEPVAAPDLGSRKARLLLKLLAVERPRTVPLERITEVLWEGAPPARPAQNIATFVSRLRRVLGADVIRGGRPGYSLGLPPAAQVDLDGAGRWAEEAERRLAAAEPALAVAAATRAHDVLAAGLVLEDEPGADWAQPARAEQAELTQRVRRVLAAAALATGDAAAAVVAAAAAVSADPYDERARRSLMRAFAAAGEPARALASYAELRDLLQEELGADPAPETQQLHLAVLREQEPPPDPAAVSPGAVSPRAVSPRAVSPAAVSPAAVSRTAVTPAVASPAAASPPAVRPAAGAPPAAGGSAEGGSAEGGSAEGGSAEGGSAEGGSAEGGSAEGGSATAARVPGPAAGRGKGKPPGLPGRAAELGCLCDAWNDAAAGRPSLFLVCGEAGIGKTRLAEELTRVATATGGTVLAARCYETERSLFLQPFADAIATVVRAIPLARMQDLAGGHAAALTRLVPEVAELLRLAPAARPEAADIERRRGFEAVTAFIRALAGRGPVLLSLDDLQNAGQATIELLHYLARHVPASRLLAVATVRTEEGAGVLDSLAGVSSRIDLGPLPPDAVASLAAEAGLSEQAESIIGRTRGHALFVVETLRALTAGNVGVPVSLEAAVLARVRRAGPSVETVLRAGAVLGASFDPGTVAGLLGERLQAVIETCADAHAARLLVVAERDYEFANDLIREVLYATTPVPTRMAYHGRAADLLTRKPEAMAGHAAAAGDSLRAARGWLLAGEQALAGAAAADAVELLTRSLTAAERAGDRDVQARALLTRGRAREALSEFADAVADIETAVSTSRAAGDRRLEMIGLVALGGDATVALGRPIAAALEPLQRGLSIATTLSDRAIEAKLRARLAILAANGLRFDEAVEQARLAVRAARAAADEEALAAALDGQKTAFAYLGEIEALMPVLDELEPLVRRHGDLYRLHWTVFESAFPPLAAGDWASATALIEAALEVHRRSGYGAHAAWHVAMLGGVACLQGRYDEAIDTGRRAVAMSDEAPHVWSAAVAGAALGATLLEAGQVAEAITVLERSRTVAQQDGADAILLRCLAPLAEATGSASILAEAAALLDGIRAPDGSAFLAGDGCYLAVARAWLVRGEPSRARAALAPLLRAAARVPWVAPLAGASLVDGRAALALGLGEEATTLLERAAELARRHGLPRIASEAAATLG